MTTSRRTTMELLSTSRMIHHPVMVWLVKKLALLPLLLPKKAMKAKANYIMTAKGGVRGVRRTLVNRRMILLLINQCWVVQRHCQHMHLRSCHWSEMVLGKCEGIKQANHRSSREGSSTTSRSECDHDGGESDNFMKMMVLQQQMDQECRQEKDSSTVFKHTVPDTSSTIPVVK